MRAGYLILRTDPAQPGMVTVRGADHPPDTAGKDAENLIFIARFSSLDIALMHFHTGLRRRLVDLNRHLYRATPAEAVAVAEAIELSHRPVYIAPDLAENREVTARVETLHRRHQMTDRLFNGIGIAAVILLLVLMALGI
ncbi:hypothetical protein F2Q65_04335 [Thiohalocapsa marina]|uniref:Uncharacterized protein n=1 Tax=Thiohalocapsa marina TaxID=424902 RepID=A0A5M8FNW1_9GAMM|nr:hypothetical protein [Thiohalocapsa marina]KAA6186613.1 hypothetical protein F2Q65_04335 [Thiohalocapsa marina]